MTLHDRARQATGTPKARLSGLLAGAIAVGFALGGLSLAAGADAAAQDKAPPAGEPRILFDLKEKRIWPGERIELVLPPETPFPAPDPKLTLEDDCQVLTDCKGKANGKDEAAPFCVILTPEPTGPGARSLGVQLPPIEPALWNRSFKILPPHAKLCVRTGPELSPVVQAIEVKLGNRWRALLLSCLAVLAVIVGVNVALHERASPGKEPPGSSNTEPKTEPKDAAGKLLFWILRPATTAVGTYNLAMVQILLWSYVTLFALTYVWSMSEGFVAIRADILELLGISSGTALFARAATSGRTHIPKRYLAKIRSARRAPGFRDLLEVDGAPSVFKLQMLVFTLVAATIVVLEVYEKCVFPVLPEQLAMLLGISSAAYVGNEALQRDRFVEIKERIAEIEKLEREPRTPAEETRLQRAQEELEELLVEVYSDADGRRTDQRNDTTVARPSTGTLVTPSASGQPTSGEAAAPPADALPAEAPAPPTGPTPTDLPPAPADASITVLTLATPPDITV